VRSQEAQGLLWLAKELLEFRCWQLRRNTEQMCTSHSSSSHRSAPCQSSNIPDIGSLNRSKSGPWRSLQSAGSQGCSQVYSEHSQGCLQQEVQEFQRLVKDSLGCPCSQLRVRDYTVRRCTCRPNSCRHSLPCRRHSNRSIHTSNQNREGPSRMQFVFVQVA